MDILSVTIVIFIIMESLNVLILYLKPDSRRGNGVAVFDSWNDAKKDESMELFSHYMTYCVASRGVGYRNSNNQGFFGWGNDSFNRNLFLETPPDHKKT